MYYSIVYFFQKVWFHSTNSLRIINTFRLQFDWGKLVMWVCYVVHGYDSKEGGWDKGVGKSSSAQPNGRIFSKRDSRASKVELMNGRSKQKS